MEKVFLTLKYNHPGLSRQYFTSLSVMMLVTQTIQSKYWAGDVLRWQIAVFTTLAGSGSAQLSSEAISPQHYPHPQCNTENKSIEITISKALKLFRFEVIIRSVFALAIVDSHSYGTFTKNAFT